MITLFHKIQEWLAYRRRLREWKFLQRRIREIRKAASLVDETRGGKEDGC